MKKIITVVLIVIILIAGYVIFQNRNTLNEISVKNSKTKEVLPSEVKIDNWSTYVNPKYGVEFVYPSGFTVKESTGYPTYISFDSLEVKLGSGFELTIYDTKKSPTITSLDTIPRLTKADFDREVISTQNITNAHSVAVQIVKGVQYAIKNGQPNKNYLGYTLSVVFMKGVNAYVVNWDCWAHTACFNDAIVSKLVDSIKLK